jgi:PAS domain S-box-containing protein
MVAPALEALLASARDVFDRVLDGCQIVDSDLRYVYLNDVAVAQSRSTREALLGRTMMECYPGIETTPMFATLTRCLRERAQHRMENEFTFPDGARIVYDLRFVPVPDGLCVLSVDVTDKRYSLAAVIDGTADAIIGRTLDGRIVSWNRGAEAMFGYTAAEMIGQSIDLLLPDRSPEDLALRARQIAAAGVVQHVEAVRKRKDGRDIDVWALASPMRDATGEIIGISSVVRDVSDLKRAQRDLSRARDELERSNRELASFSYSVAHDLRAPLRGIDGFSQALLEDHSDQLDAEGRRYLERVRTAAQLMGRLIDDMLRLSKVTRAEIRRERIDLSALARAAADRLAQREPGRVITRAIEPGLEVDGDPALVALLLDNLLANAWKFTRTKTASHVEVGRVEGSDPPIFFVRDDGVGFDMQYASKLFGVFQRLHSTADFEGTGVGLATVQRIAAKHGGRAWAAGAVDRGATFFFTLAPGEPTKEVSG